MFRSTIGICLRMAAPILAVGKGENIGRPFMLQAVNIYIEPSCLFGKGAFFNKFMGGLGVVPDAENIKISCY
ncbi:hypothetical protein [Flavobacterium rhizosphaerae]|uniref:hypothetical protein n=1 Tax=Flavobacterium rhizosphaerae TaxID=3163298 RepID=UPI0038B43BC0